MNLRIIRKDDASDSHRTLAATGLSPPQKKMAKPTLPNGVSNMESVLGGGACGSRIRNNNPLE